MYAVHDSDGKRIGTIMKVAGEPPATRWMAYALGDQRKGFSTRKAALQWIEETTAKETRRPD